MFLAREVKMFKILSDGQLLEVVSSIPKNIKPDKSVTVFLQSECQAVAKAEQEHTLKQVIEWGKMRCITHNTRANDVLRRECWLCWAEIQKEVESE